MTSEELKHRYRNVCEVPSNSGFRVEHMPEFFQDSDVDDCSPHVHTFYEILWFQKGYGRHTIDFTEYEVTPGTVFFLAPGQIHHFDHREGYEGVAIKMCTDFMREDEGQRTRQLRYKVFHRTDGRPLFRLDEGSVNLLSPLVKAMEEEVAHSGEIGHSDILHALLQVLFITIERNDKGDAESVNEHLRPSQTLFLNFRNLLEQNYPILHGVQDYADLLHVSVRTLNKCVNECANKSPLAFINERIMLEAKRMVRYSTLMVKEIAADLGYEDPSYFVKFFKRQTGYLPLEFRHLDLVSYCPIHPDHASEYTSPTE